MFQIKKWFPFFLFFLVTHLAFGQKYTISGHVKHASNGEEMIAASIAVKGQMMGTVTNNYGFYCLTIDKGEYTIVYRFVGYDDVERKVVLNKNPISKIIISA